MPSFWRHFLKVSCYISVAVFGLPHSDWTISSAIAGEQPAEDRQPQRELEEDDKAEVGKIKQQIDAEKKRLQKFDDAVKKITDDLQAPTQKLGELRKALGAVADLREKVEAKNAAAILNEIKKAVGGIPDNGRLIAAVGEYVAEKSKPNADARKIDAAEKKIREAEKQLAEKLQKPFDDLNLKRMEAEITRRKESGMLNALRARLLALYGYEVEGMGVVLFEAEGSAGGDAAVMRWIDNEIALIEMLSSLGYDDLATNYLVKIERANNPYTGKPFPASLKNYMGKAKAKLLQQKAVATNKLDEKLTLGEESIDDYQRVLERLTPMTTAYYEASLDLIAVYFRLADDLAEVAGTRALVSGSDFKPAKITAFEPLKKATAKKSAKAATAAAKTVKINEKFANKDPKALNDLALAQAAMYYNDGLRAALALYEVMGDVFMDLFDLYQGAGDDEKPEEQKHYMDLIIKFTPYKLRLQHSIESAYAKWANLYPVNSAEYQTIVTKGDEFVNANLDDYQNIFPDDKQVYGYWMEMQSGIAEPLFVKKDGQPLPSFIEVSKEEQKELSKAEIEAEKRNLGRYPYSSDRIEQIFSQFIIGDEKMRGKPDKREPIQNMRVRALNNYLQARANLVRNTYRRADSESDAAKQTAYKERGKALESQAETAFAEVARNNSSVGETEAAIRYGAYAKTIIPYYLFLAERAAKANQKKEASEYAQAAMDAVLLLSSAAENNWKSQGGELLLLLQEFIKQHGLTVGGTDPDDMRLPLIVSNAEKAYSAALDADRAGKNAEAAAKFKEARDFYLLGLERARNLVDKVAREQFFPKALNNLTVAAVKLKDYATAYVASQLLVQEFRNDFKEVLKNYPPEKYPNVKNYFNSTLNNLRAAAALRVKERPDHAAQRDYIDALLLCIRYSNKNDDYMLLLNAFKKMQQYAQAVKFIDNVSPNNDYYRLAQLMGAGIYIDLAKQYASEIKAINERISPPLNDDGQPIAPAATGEEKVELEKRLAELEKLLTESRTQAGVYADKFVNLHLDAAKKWEAETAAGVTPSDYVKDLRAKERQEVLKAQFIPLLVAHAAQKWDDVIKLVPEFLAKVDTNKISENEEKQTFRENALWMAFDAKIKSLDYQTASLTDGAKNLEAAANAAEALAKIDVKDRFGATVATVFGSRWNFLAERAKKENAPDAEKRYRLEAVNWLEKAEGLIYGQLGGAVSMLSTLSDQKLWQRAIVIGEKIINYWGDCLFTDNSIYQPHKTANDLKPSAAAEALSGVLKTAEITAAAAKPETLAKKLNEFILKTDPKPNAAKYQKALTEALNANSGDKKFVSVLTQAQELVGVLGNADTRLDELLKQRDYLAKDIGAENQALLNRTILEAAYIDALFRRPLTNILPPPILFYKQFGVTGYSSEAGRKKADILIAMIEPNFSNSAAKAVFGADYPQGRDGGYVKEWKDALAETEDPVTKGKLQRLINAVETPLVVSLYGEPDPKRKGNLIKRNYGRARTSLMTILEYEKDHPTTDNGGKLLFAEAANNLIKALAFQNTLLAAKKNYAQAMVEDGKYNEALKYVEELCKAFPSDWSLSLELARVYTAMAKFTNKNGTLTPRPYNKETATEYLRAITQSLAVAKFTAPGSEAWWEAQLMMLRSQIDSLQARKNAPPDLQAAIEGVEIQYTDPRTGKAAKSKTSIKPYDKVGNDTAVLLQRYLASVDPTPPENIVAELELLVKELAAIGFTATLEKAAAAPTPEIE